MPTEKPNCMKCFYRILLVRMGEHVWWTDCNQYEQELCRKMNDPGFIKWQEEGRGSINV